MTIGIIEDDRLLSRSLKVVLEKEGYRTLQVYTKKDAGQILQGTEELLLVDIGLPDGNGMELYHTLMKKWNRKIPAIFLTARDEEQEMLKAFDLGAEDYVVKPFSTPVLLARIEVLLRRNRISEGTSSYQSNGVVVDMGSRLCCRGDKTLRLPVEEWKMLICLLGAGGKIVSKEQLCRAIWAEGADYVEENTSRVIISRLRKHLEGIGSAGAIETSRGYGYRWILPVEKH